MTYAAIYHVAFYLPTTEVPDYVTEVEKHQPIRPSKAHEKQDM